MSAAPRRSPATLPPRSFSHPRWPKQLRPDKNPGPRPAQRWMQKRWSQNKHCKSDVGAMWGYVPGEPTGADRLSNGTGKQAGQN